MYIPSISLANYLTSTIDLAYFSISLKISPILSVHFNISVSRSPKIERPALRMALLPWVRSLSQKATKTGVLKFLV
jgi:hypothetical protein